MATKNFIEELEWRGMIHTIMPGAKEQLEKEQTTAYLGIDPTADSLHIGHLVGVMILKHFQMCGHRPLALVGGATGMIGDPSGKSQERNLLDEKTLRHNQEAIKRQLAKLLDFDSDAPNAAALVNNYDWMKEFTFLDFIRDIGKCITVNYMMAKDSVKKRFSGEGDGMSFTEFTYQLVQGFDFLHLYQTMNCKVQLGGADQWGNITTGTELIRRKLGAEAEAFGITCPLITKADGTKFGKTESGNVWLDPRYTSPYKFYQFWLNVSDEDAKRYIKIFTLLDRETIDALIAEHDAAPHLRVLQKRLAEEITCLIHSLLMPGGEEGLRFLFRPDFSKVTPSTVLVALGQAFFSLSIGIGTMVTYASYFKPDTNLRHTALNVTILDTLVAVLAGVVIFPAVFSVGIEPSSGPSLVFITLPGIFNSMPLSMVWSSVFFLLLVVAALTSTISLHEVITAYLHEEWHMSRRAAAWSTTGACMALAAVASLSLGVLKGWNIFGLTIFDSLDYLTANILLPAGGFFTCIFVGWRLDRKILKAEISNNGTLKFRIYGVFIFLVRYVCPAVLLLIFLDNLGLF